MKPASREVSFLPGGGDMLKIDRFLGYCKIIELGEVR